MASSQDLFDCSICLQVLDDPVTTACGHSYCLRCINAFWDVRNNRREGYSCPQCRQTYSSRPDLKRSTLVAALLEEHERTTSRNAAAAAPGDVQCDACTGRKRKAWMFCLVCVASYCETHLKPHFEVAPLRAHGLIQASARAKDSLCVRHGKLPELYCRSDQQFACVLCALEEHRGHDTVTVLTEQCDTQGRLERGKQEVADRVLNSERTMTELRQAAGSIRDAAWKVCDDYERLCVERIRTFVRSVERKRSEMREKVGEAEKAGVDWTNSRLGQLEREVLELRRREDNLDQLSLIEDPIQFLQGFHALGCLPVFTDSHEGLDMLTEFTSTQTDKLKNICSKEKKELFSHSEEHLLSKTPRLLQEKTSRTCLLKRFRNSTVEVDPNTVAACLCLSDGNRAISWSDGDQAHPDHTDRFTFYHQALCRGGLEGSHYWEVEWDGGIVDLAVSYKGIQRKGSGRSGCFGHNELSWKLTCSRRVGMHLDHEAGTLDFYSVSGSDTLTRLHQIQTTFTEPLCPGFSVDLGSTLKICNI
ncbi:E3 ubiquitin-protein ligase TRIM47-like isoform X2 [Cyclopterus lumpus]|uniref:E3 ubiquitin-protein ligase TRIM47-like isoform X2 n=1 Tax=Cyclopterus lumpus TaxID=8103 RepID=UPI001485C9F0|nr:E3 ubiquitin-protein ligase TRIM47-like isoform X2 [Cyclopterus lumpus]